MVWLTFNLYGMKTSRLPEKLCSGTNRKDMGDRVNEVMGDIDYLFFFIARDEGFRFDVLHKFSNVIDGKMVINVDEPFLIKHPNEKPISSIPVAGKVLRKILKNNERDER